jgi:hypothetical protein
LEKEANNANEKKMKGYMMFTEVRENTNAIQKHVSLHANMRENTIFI